MKILMMPLSIFFSHTLRLLDIAKELRRRKHQVVFACKNDPGGMIKKNKFQRIEIYEVSKQRFDNFLKNFRITDKKVLNKMVDVDLRTYKKIKPDLVVSDFRISCRISTEISKIKFVSINNIYSSRFHNREYVSFPANLKFHKFLNQISKHFHFLLKLIEKYFIIINTIPFNKVRKKYGLKTKKVI